LCPKTTRPRELYATRQLQQPTAARLARRLACGDTPHTASPPQNSPFKDYQNTHSRISAKRLGDIPVWRSATPRHTPMAHSASDVLPRLSFALGSPVGAPRADLRLPPLALGNPRLASPPPQPATFGPTRLADQPANHRTPPKQ